jgi:hypothetical protein
MAQAKAATDFRELQALAEQTSAIREHTEELRRQRRTEQQSANPTPVASVALPPGAKFRFREETYWHVARQYSGDEARLPSSKIYTVALWEEVLSLLIITTDH